MYLHPTRAAIQFATEKKRNRRISFIFALILTFSLSLIAQAAPGDLDTSFGTSGKVFSELPSGAVYTIAIQPDGRIIAAGDTNQPNGIGFILIRYNPNGTFDTTFGTNGKVTTLFGVNVDVNAIVLQTDGKILVAGYGAIAFGPGANHDFLVARFLPDGTLDTSFGDGGKVFTDFNRSLQV